MTKSHLRHLATFCFLVSTLISCANNSDMIQAGDSVAAIEINDSTETEIRQAVIETFLTNGYQRESPYGLTFEKRGNFVRQLEYATYMGGAATMRVKIHIQQISARSHVLSINPYTVTNQGSTSGSNEKPVRGLRKGHYKNLLLEVKERLPSR